MEVIMTEYSHSDNTAFCGGQGMAVGATGSEVEIADSSGNLAQAGTTITASGAEINRIADKSASVVVANGDTLTVTKELHGDRYIAFGKASGTTVTLPAALGTGDKYTFIIATAATSNANIIQVANATDVMDGSLAFAADTDGEGATGFTWMAEVGDDTMTFAGAATTGGIVGNRIECIDYAAGFWCCTAWTISGGGAEATPFSAAVT
jgi:hypothetical protein